MAETYKARAAEIRQLAEHAKMPENREELLGLAESYERLAALAEHRRKAD